MHSSLPAHGSWRRRPRVPRLKDGRECRTRSRSCLDHADQGIRASTPDPPASVQYRRRSSAKAAPRRRDVERAAPQRPREPAGWIPGPQRGWPGSPSAAGQRMYARWNRPAPTVVAAQRFDHLPITGRSRGQRLVHPSITRHSVARQGLNDGIPSGDTRRWRAAAPIPARKGAAWVTPRPGSAALMTCEPGQEHPARDLAAAPLRPDAHPAAAGRSDLQVRVAASAGPAPPPATYAQPEAPPASA